MASNDKIVRKKRKELTRDQQVKRQRLLTIVAALLVVVAVAVCIISWNASYRKLDLNEITAITYEGYDSVAVATVVLEDVVGCTDFINSVHISLDHNEALSNGDTIAISYAYDEQKAKEQKIRVKASDWVLTVEGLPEATVISMDELFEGLQVTTQGVSPAIEMVIENISTDPFLQTVQYVFTQDKQYYRLGDYYSIKALYDPQYALQSCIAVEGANEDYTKTFEIVDGDTYLTDASMLSKEQLQTLIDEGAKLISGDANEFGLRIFSESGIPPVWVNGLYTFKWEGAYAVSAYFSAINEESIGSVGSHNNDVCIVYKATVSQADGKATGAEVVVRFTDLMRYADGTYDLALHTGKIISASHRDASIKKVMNYTGTGDYYDTTKLELP